MLLSKTCLVKWNPKNKKYYVSLGYEFTKFGDCFSVQIKDLSSGCGSSVDLICDYCGKKYSAKWSQYVKHKTELNKKDCCRDNKCTTLKSQESIYMLYGVNSIRELDWVNEKIKKTNLDRYGSENVFSNDLIKEKIKKYWLENYGVDHNMKVPEIVDSVKESCLELYGETNWMKTYQGRAEFTGDCSPVWKGDGVKSERTERDTPVYREWRRKVFERDSYTCKCCGAKNGNGKYIRLEAHHIYNWNDYHDLRYSLGNGITLCQSCHLKFHSAYGKRENNDAQLEEFLTNNNVVIDKKIC